MGGPGPGTARFFTVCNSLYISKQISGSVLTTSDQFCINSQIVTVYTAGYFIATYIYIYLITTGLSVWLSFRQIKRLNTSDFHYSAVEVFARLACYTAYVRNWLPAFGTTFRSRLQQPSMLDP
jgi:hypothetical protein